MVVQNADECSIHSGYCRVILTYFHMFCKPFTSMAILTAYLRLVQRWFMRYNIAYQKPCTWLLIKGAPFAPRRLQEEEEGQLFFASEGKGEVQREGEWNEYVFWRGREEARAIHPPRTGNDRVVMVYSADWLRECGEG